ncbi:MAG: hypothetical protein HOV81_42860 [Kofleriaceae bacterium]|nr:hypothetical protein [Kofleriaceae bacterium]
MPTPRRRFFPFVRPPSIGRARAWWCDFLRIWQRLGLVHVELETAPDDDERWRRLWHRDDRGRYVSHPWRRWHKPGRYV